MRVECWVLNQAVDKEPEVSFDLVRLDINSLVLFFEDFHDLVHYLVSEIVHMRTTFDGADRIDKGNLLELAITKGAHDFPSVVTFLYNLWKLLVLLSLKV